jgi:hypothetical protein
MGRIGLVPVLLLDGWRIDYPPSQQVDTTFKEAKKAVTGDGASQMSSEGESNCEAVH